MCKCNYSLTVLTLFAVLFLIGVVFAQGDKVNPDAVMERVRNGDTSNTYDLWVKMGPEVIPALILYLQDEHPLVRFEAVFGLRIIGDERAIPPFCMALDDTDKNVRASAVKALNNIEREVLKKYSNQAYPALLAYLERGDFESYLAALLLGDLGEATFVPELKSALEKARAQAERSGSEAVIGMKMKDACIQALAKLNDDVSFEVIINELESNDEMKRYEAIKKLGYVGRESGVKYLIKFIGDVSTPDTKTLHMPIHRFCDATAHALAQIVDQSFFQKSKEPRFISDEDVTNWEKWWTENKEKFEDLNKED